MRPARARLTSFQTSLTKSNLFGFQSDCRVVVHIFCGYAGKLVNCVQEGRLLLDLNIKFYHNRDVSENCGINKAGAKCEN